MAGQVKGITIEYDGDTTKLQTALNKIKSESGSVESELRKINQNLRFDPHNTELLATKQDLLKNRIEQSKQQLTEFKQVQAQLDAKKVDKTSVEYLKVKRAVLEAEGKVRTFNAQLARMQWQGVTKAGSAIKDTGAKLTHATRYARLFAGALAGIALYKGFERLKALDEVSKQMEVLGYRGEKLEKIMDGVSNSVSGTRFMLQDMSKVAAGALGSGVTEKYQLNEYLTRTADLAQLAGIDVQSMGAMLNKAYSKGKIDAKILNQLNAHGIPVYKLLQKQLSMTANKLTEMTRKGEVGFDDLYKATDRYDGLAQKMGTETLPGALTVLQQQFGLIGADFLSGVYEPLKQGTQGLVDAIKRMRQDGTFKEWGQDVGDVIRYFVALLKDGEASMDGLSGRAKTMVGVLNPVISTVGGLVDILSKLPPELQGALVLFTLFGGPALQGVGTAVSLFGQAGQAVQTFAMNAQAGVLPTTGLATGISSMGGAVSLLLNPLTIGIGLLAAWGLGVKKMYDETHASTQAFEEFKAGAEKNIDAVRASNGEIDLYKAKLDELMGKEEKSAADKALIKQYVQQLNSAIGDLNLKYDEEKDKLNQTSDAIQKKIDRYKEAALVKAYQDEITAAAKQEVEAQKRLEQAIKDQAEARERWKNSTDHSRVAQVGFDSQMAKSRAKIQDAKKAINDARSAMDTWAKKASNASGEVKKSLHSAAESSKKEGTATGTSYGSNIAKTAPRVRAGANAIANSARKGLRVDTSGMGRDFGSGFIRGIGSMVGSVAAAARNFVKRAISAAKSEQKSGSPSRVMRAVGREYGQGYTLGIGDEEAAAQAAASSMVGSAIHAATVPARMVLSGAATGGIQTQNSTSSMNNVFNIYGATDADGVAQEIADRLKMQIRMA